MFLIFWNEVVLWCIRKFKQDLPNRKLFEQLEQIVNAELPFIEVEEYQEK